MYTPEDEILKYNVSCTSPLLQTLYPASIDKDIANMIQIDIVSVIVGRLDLNAGVSLFFQNRYIKHMVIRLSDSDMPHVASANLGQRSFGGDGICYEMFLAELWCCFD